MVNKEVLAMLPQPKRARKNPTRVSFSVPIQMWDAIREQIEKTTGAAIPGNVTRNDELLSGLVLLMDSAGVSKKDIEKIVELR